ncbi:TIGR04076 family protein [Clostridium cylindrosporum]|uniref:TIGR04076 family protein n=1 Tax=Clostridium cylindrosporum DSM 605 TaxID=1121307 RepID=A0A0J8G6W5_CLOCY|nr:TIGR04076 family protein [Clostridium cylindrosporum]KMT23331.1 TIGR04076 family protein [Clostridium cylindrosporum DSM 605]
MSVKDIKITVIQVVNQETATAKANASVDSKVGDEYIAKNCEKPEGLSDTAWLGMKRRVVELATGDKDPLLADGSTTVCCNDGARPVYYNLETV